MPPWHSTVSFDNFTLNGLRTSRATASVYTTSKNNFSEIHIFQQTPQLSLSVSFFSVDGAH